MTLVVNLKGRALRPTDCGGCSGSSSDQKVRTEPRAVHAAEVSAAEPSES